MGRAHRGKAAEHGEADREVVGRQRVQGVGPDVGVAAAEPRRAHAGDLADRARGRQGGEALDARVPAPLVHHGEPVAARGEDRVPVVQVDGQRLLAEDRAAEGRDLEERRGVVGGGRDDDDAVDGAAGVAERADDPRGAARGRSLARGLAARQHRHAGAELAQVAQHVHAPAAAAVEEDVERHGSGV